MDPTTTPPAQTTTELVEDGATRDRLGRATLPRARRAALLADYDRSGLSQAAFARRAGVAYTTFAHWVQRRAREGAGATPPPCPPAARVAPRFVELHLPAQAAAPTPAPAQGAELSVILPCGLRLHGPLTQPAALAALVRALRAEA